MTRVPPVSYTNRKGQTFYLHERTRRDGRCCFVFMREPSEGVLSRVPPGHEIVEGVHGTVSLRKQRPRAITDIELQAVRRLLRREPRLELCRAAVKGRTVEVYEPQGMNDFPAPEGAVPPGWPSRRSRDLQERLASYWPQMRFVLVDRDRRIFRVERMCYRSWHDGWLSLDKTGPIADLAAKYLPHLGRESFFELFPSSC